MTLEEAKQMYEKLKIKLQRGPDEGAEYMLADITEFLVKETHDSWYISDLGGYYYSHGRYDLALKYFEEAKALGDPWCTVGIADIWYNGYLVEPDYEKAFKGYTEAAENGGLMAEVMLADMYDKGQYVKQDHDKYCEMMEKLYEKQQKEELPLLTMPDIYTRLARIRKEEHDELEAIKLYMIARGPLEERIMYVHDPKDIQMMEELITDMYSMVIPDVADIRLYDAFVLLKEPGVLSFMYHGHTYEIRARREGNGLVFEFGGTEYRTLQDLFVSAEIDDLYLIFIYNKLYNFKVGRRNKEAKKKMLS